MACEVATERHHGQFGAVIYAAEHGFAAEEAAKGETVESRQQLTVLPDLDGVGMAQAVQLPLGVDHGGAYPGAAGAATGGGAGRYHLIEGIIDGNVEGGAAQILLQAAPYV